MLSISEYVKKETETKIPHLLVTVHCHIHKLHSLQKKNSPRKQMLEHCRGPHYPLLKEIMSQEHLISVYSYWWEGVKREPDFSVVPKQRHIVPCLNRTQFYYLVVWAPGRLHREGCGDFQPLTRYSPEQSVFPDLTWGGRTRWWSSIVPANLNHCQAVVCLSSAEVKEQIILLNPLAVLFQRCAVGLFHYKGTLLPPAQLFQMDSGSFFCKNVSQPVGYQFVLVCDQSSILPQMWDLTFSSVELHKVPMFLLLQCIEGLWTGTIWHRSLSSQFCVTSKLGEGALSHHPGNY